MLQLGWCAHNVCVFFVFCFFNQESKSSGDILLDSTNGSIEDWDGVLWVPARVLWHQNCPESQLLWSPLVGSKCYRWEALFRSNLYGPDTPPRPGFLTLSAVAGQRSYIFHWAPSFPPTASTSYRVKLLCEQLRLHTLHLHSSSWQVVTQQLSIFPLPLRRRFHISAGSLQPANAPVCLGILPLKLAILGEIKSWRIEQRSFSNSGFSDNTGDSFGCQLRCIVTCASGLLYCKGKQKKKEEVILDGPV